MEYFAVNVNLVYKDIHWKLETYHCHKRKYVNKGESIKRADCVFRKFSINRQWRSAGVPVRKCLCHNLDFFYHASLLNMVMIWGDKTPLLCVGMPSINHGMVGNGNHTVYWLSIIWHTYKNVKCGNSYEVRPWTFIRGIIFLETDFGIAWVLHQVRCEVQLISNSHTRLLWVVNFTFSFFGTSVS